MRFSCWILYEAFAPCMISDIYIFKFEGIHASHNNLGTLHRFLLLGIPPPRRTFE